MVKRLDPSQLPSATRASFALLLMIVLIAAFSLSQNVPIFFRDRSEWPAFAHSFVNGAFGAMAALASGIVIYLFHPWLRARSFGRCREIAAGEPLAVRVDAICRRLKLVAPRLLIDGDIRNYDALAFGLPWRKTILMGRGLLLLNATRPDELEARLAHELGHIHNKDIAATFIAEALILVSTLFFAGNIVLFFYRWGTFFFQSGEPILVTPGGVVLSVPLAALGQIVKTASWGALLFAEHRAFLRMRELYADNVAANVIGGQAIKDALGPDQELTVGFFSRTFLRIFAAHPPVAWRKAVVDDPMQLIDPVPLRLGATGYLIGLLISTVEGIRDIPDVGDGGMSSLLTAAFTTVAGAAVIGFFSLLILFPFVAVVSTILRSASWLVLKDGDSPANIGKVLCGAIMLSIGVAVGINVNPTTLQSLVQRGGQVAAVVPDNMDLSLAATVGCAVFVGAVAFFGVTRRLLKSPKATPPSIVTWLSIGITQYLSISYLILMVFAFSDAQVARRGDTYPLMAVEFAIAVMWCLVAYLIARRTISLKPQSTADFAPWIFGEQIEGPTGVADEKTAQRIPVLQ